MCLNLIGNPPKIERDKAVQQSRTVAPQVIQLEVEGWIIPATTHMSVAQVQQQAKTIGTSLCFRASVRWRQYVLYAPKEAGRQRLAAVMQASGFTRQMIQVPHTIF